MNATANARRCSSSTCGRCTVLSRRRGGGGVGGRGGERERGEKGKTVEKRKGNVRQRGTVSRSPSSLFFSFRLSFPLPRPPPKSVYTSMLVGLSQQTTPMTTRLKFHGMLREFGHISLSPSFPLSLSLSLSLSVSRALATTRLYMIPLCAPVTAPDRPVAVRSIRPP